MSRANVIWITPSATRFSCLCELCLDAHPDGSSFLEAVRIANVHGSLAEDTDIAFVRCAFGHELVVRRVDRPPKLQRKDGRQLQLV